MPDKIKEPLSEPRCERGAQARLLVSFPRAVRIREDLCARLNVRRPGGSPSLGALLDAIYHGRIALRRRDDPEGREFWIGQEAGQRSEDRGQRTDAGVGKKKRFWWQKD